MAQEFVYAVTVGRNADTAEIVADVARLAKADDVDSAYVGKKKRRPNGDATGDVPMILNVSITLLVPLGPFATAEDVMEAGPKFGAGRLADAMAPHGGDVGNPRRL